VRIFERRGGVPAEVTARAGLPRGERVLASTETTDGTWVLGTRSLLVVLPAPAAGHGSARRIPWQQVEDATWDQDASTLTVTEVGTYGERRPVHTFAVEDPALLLQLVRERVTASIVLQRWVPVRDKQGLTVIGRRSPVGGPIVWMYVHDRGLDPDDPDLPAAAERALAAARSEVGDEVANPI
jgi:hypothetical protein